MCSPAGRVEHGENGPDLKKRVLEDSVLLYSVVVPCAFGANDQVKGQPKKDPHGSWLSLCPRARRTSEPVGSWAVRKLVCVNPSDLVGGGFLSSQ